MLCPGIVPELSTAEVSRMEKTSVQLGPPAAAVATAANMHIGAPVLAKEEQKMELTGDIRRLNGTWPREMINASTKHELYRSFSTRARI